jgi:predicted nucleic acid-binding protein
MIYLFDTSAIINLIQKKKKDAAGILKGQCTSDLAYYEAGNVIWKLHHRKLLTAKECKEILGDIRGIWEQMQVISYSTMHMISIFEIALAQKLSFYDASYLFYRQHLDAFFITDDEKLHDAAAESGQVDYSTRFDIKENIST